MKKDVKEFIEIADKALTDSFEAIKLGCRTVADGSDSVSLAEFSILVGKARWTPRPEIAKMVDDYHRVLGSILQATIKNCLVTGTDRVKLEYVDEVFDLFMKEYKKTIQLK